MPSQPPDLAASTRPRRNPPHVPTPLETLLVAAYPALLVFGSAFALLSPQTRSAPYDPAARAHQQDPALAPGYFARKDNVFNTLFVKRGWGWVSLAFWLFALTHPGLAAGARRWRAGVRWALVTLWWVLVTQWFFGPALIDRGFRFTGGRCDVVETVVESGGGDAADVFTAVACKAVGGRWSGGHDISGHVFLLVLGSAFLLQEVGWVARRWRAGGAREERSVIMPDGAVKSAEVEGERVSGAAEDALGIGGKFAAAVVVLSTWMLLMTAIYFHTWFEKLTGLLVALTGLYAIYIVPRWVPAVRGLVGLPGI